MGFFTCFRFYCYAHGFFDVFVQLVRFRCYVHGFFMFFIVVDAMFIGLLVLGTVRFYVHGFFDRVEPCAAICMGFLIVLHEVLLNALVF